MLTLVDVKKLLKNRFIESIVTNKLRFFTVFSGYVAEIKEFNDSAITSDNKHLLEVALPLDKKDLPFVDKIKFICQLKKQQIYMKDIDPDELMVTRYLKLGSEQQLEFIEIPKSVSLCEMMQSELSTTHCYVDYCLSILGKTDINTSGYILYEEELMANTGSVLKNKKGAFFPVLFSEFTQHYELKPLSLNLTKASVFFLKEEVNSVVEEIKAQRKLELKENRNKTIETINRKRTPKKRKGIEFAIDLWSKNQSLGKNEMARQVNSYLRSLGIEKLSKDKTVASTWLIKENVPNMPSHASDIGSKKRLSKN